MGEDISLEFDYMEKDRVVAKVTQQGEGKVDCVLYTDDIMDNPLPFGNNGESLSHFFRSRCFPETRANKDELLALLGLKHYVPLVIVRKTRGLQYDDFYWIRFKGDTATWDEIKIRD